MTMGKKKLTPLGAALVAVVATLLIGGGGAYLLGYLGPQAVEAEHVHDMSVPVEVETKEGTKTLWTCGMHPWILSEEPGLCPICGMELTPKRDAAESAAPGERAVAYWRAPMDPMEIYDAPGKSKMGMDLVPVYEDELIGGVEIKVDPVTQQNMGIRTELARAEPLVRTVSTYGHVTYDETRIAEVSLRFSGWIEKLRVDFTGQPVTKGQPLFEIYSPELLSAQEEFLVAFRSLGGAHAGGSAANRELLESARRRLRYFGVADREIEALEKSGEAARTLTIRSPFAGVVTHKNALEGVFVKPGAPVYRIADLSRVWVEAHIYEYELPWVKAGQTAEMRLPYQPGEIFTGTVAFVYPYLQQKTRDVVVRLEFDNPAQRLKPDMYADVVIRSEQRGMGTTVPAEAVIRSGERDVVFVARGEGKFTPREVELGLTLDGGRVQVLTGVAAGEEVVVSGQFLLDSESKLKEAVQKMMEAKAGTGEKAAENDFFEELEEEEDDFFDDMKNE